jgi:hypothetical protein
MASRTRHAGGAHRLVAVRPPTRIGEGTQGYHDPLPCIERAPPARRTTSRRRAGGMRADQALSGIKSSPGITVSEIADRMGIRQNYLYRVTAALQKQGSVKRQGQEFKAT